MAIWLTKKHYCIYCGNPAEEAEHVFPKSQIKKMDAAGLMQFEFLAASCYRCNRIAGAKVFETLGGRIDYVQSTLKERKVWPIPRVPERLRNVKIVGRGFLEDKPYSAAHNAKIHGGLDTSEEMIEKGLKLGIVKKCGYCSEIFFVSSRDTGKFCSRYCRRKGRNNIGLCIGYV